MSLVQPAHRALFIEEIVRAILEYVPGWLREEETTIVHLLPMDTEASRTLARVARVCKFFSDFALDTLWKDLHDLEHLLRILPAFQMKSETGKKPYFCLNGDISGQEWTRLMTYANRVRRFENLRRRFDIAVFERLAQLCKGSPLLPSLQELRWRGSVECLRPEILLFIAPGLRLLSLCEKRRGLTVAYPTDCRPYYHSPRAGVPLAMAKMLTDRAVGLEVLNVPLTPATISFWETLQVGRFPKLREVHFRTRTSVWHEPELPVMPQPVPPSLAALATVQCLEFLTLEIYTHSRSPVPASLLFGSLESLNLSIQRNSSWALQFFAAVAAPRLRGLAIGVLADINNPPFLQESMPIIASKFVRSLREVRLAQAIVMVVSHRTMFQTLLPLLRLPRLTTVYSIFIGCAQSLTDDDICSMARAWPRLSELDIEIDNDTGFDDSIRVLPSLACLQALAQQCPKLGAVTLPVALALPASAPVIMPSRAMSHSLGKLYLRLSRLQADRGTKFIAAPGEVESIAWTIHQLFPCLHLPMCLSASNEPGTDPTAWDSVIEAIALLQDSNDRDMSI